MGKRAVWILAALLAAAGPLCAAQGAGDGLSVPLSGTMPVTVSFQILPAEPEPPSAAGDVPIAVYSFNANSLRGARFAIGPADGPLFVLSDASGMAYPYEVAICGYDDEGRLTTISQSGEALDAVITGTNQKGEVYARFPFFDDPAYRFVAEALESRGKRDGAPPLLTSLLYIDLVMI